jgi:predicted permease
MDNLLRDARYVYRALARTPGYTAAVALTLALGIGAMTAVFTLIDRALIRPLPYPDTDRLVLIREQNSQSDWNTSVADFQGIAEQSRSFDAVAAARTMDLILTGADGPQWVSARAVTAGFFDVLGLAPARGRAFQPGEDRLAEARVVVLGHALAERHFGTETDPLGRTLVLDGEPHVVVGVMPPGAEGYPGMRAELWPILQLAEPTRRGPFSLTTIGRLKEGVSVPQATDDLAAVSRALFALWQVDFRDETARLVPRSLHAAILGNVGEFLQVAFGAVLVVLLIAIVNVSNLAMMRTAERARDLAVRAVLGASRRSVARLLLTEACVLGALAGVLGLGLAALLLELYRAFGPDLPGLAELRIDARAAAFGSVIALLGGAVVGAIPLLFDGSGRGNVAPNPARGATASRGQQLMRNGLVALELALALPLLVAAGLLINSLVKLQHVDPGFDADRLLSARVRLLETSYPDAAARMTLWDRALEDVRAIPGVSSAALAGVLPPACGCYNNFDVVGRPAEQGSQPQSAWVAVTAGYFDALGVPLLDGRTFDTRDTPETTPVVVVTETWAARYFPGESVVGKQLIEGGNTSDPVTIVGIVGDLKFDGLDGPGDTVFAFMNQGWPNNPAYLHLRTNVEPTAIAGALRATLQRLDSALVPTELTTLSSVLDESLSDRRHWAALISSFALSAVLLAAVGVFAVLMYYVSRQYREIAIRLALGADARGVTWLVLARGLACALVGIAIGAVLAAVVTLALESLLFGVGRLDAPTLVGASALLLGITLLACWVPARRAARIEPMQALRQD